MMNSYKTYKTTSRKHSFMDGLHAYQCRKKSIDTLFNFIETSMIIGYFVGCVNNSQN